MNKYGRVNFQTHLRGQMGSAWILSERQHSQTCSIPSVNSHLWFLFKKEVSALNKLLRISGFSHGLVAAPLPLSVNVVGLNPNQRFEYIIQAGPPIVTLRDCCTVRGVIFWMRH